MCPQQVSCLLSSLYCKLQVASTYYNSQIITWRYSDAIFIPNGEKERLMKFGKNLNRMVELSDPEWGPYWINYKFMKKKIKELAEKSVCPEISDACNPSVISKSAPEVEFFLLLKTELKKTAHHFSCAEQLCDIRHQRVQEGLAMLYGQNNNYDKKMWTRLLMACVKFYKDILLLENFAIMNYCGFSKILKKHDKSTGYLTRDAFMRNVMSQQNFTHYPHVLYLLQQSERLFAEIQGIERFADFFWKCIHTQLNRGLCLLDSSIITIR